MIEGYDIKYDLLNCDFSGCGEDMDLLKQFEFINWDFWSALAAWTEIMIFFIPAVAYFFYSKFSFVSYWIFNQTSNGMNIAIHNKSKSSLFILQEEICVKNSQNCHTYCLPMKSNCDMNQICIRPDDVIYINIDFEIYNISSFDQIILYIQFGGKKRKQKKKIKRGNAYVCKS